MAHITKLELAKESDRRRRGVSRRSGELCSDQDAADLAIAWVKGEISLAACGEAIYGEGNKNKVGVYIVLTRGFKVAWEAGRIAPP